MKSFTSTDIENYYDQTEVHYRMFWQLDKSMGLHYGVWDQSINSLSEAIKNTNYLLMNLGEIKSSDFVLDCGCGVGGSAIYLSKKLACRAIGITLSAKQVKRANEYAIKEGVKDMVSFYQKNYLDTGFNDNSFDIIWAIESFGSSPNKAQFFKEMGRILKPGGKILFADTFKPYSYGIDNDKEMQVMLNGWAISDILSIEELREIALEYDFRLSKLQDVTKEIKKSVIKIYWASVLGMIGTKLYNLYKKASFFSRIHYTTGIAQKKAYNKGKWGYYLIVFENIKSK